MNILKLLNNNLVIAIILTSLLFLFSKTLDATLIICSIFLQLMACKRPLISVSTISFEEAYVNCCLILSFESKVVSLPPPSLQYMALFYKTYLININSHKNYIFHLMIIYLIY